MPVKGARLNWQQSLIRREAFRLQSLRRIRREVSNGQTTCMDEHSNALGMQ
jgi:hypothetical protein